MGFIGYGVSLAFQFIGTKLSTAANGALVTSATPAFVLLFAFWILGERVTRQRLAALGLATLGVIIVIDPRTARLSPELFWGNLKPGCGRADLGFIFSADPKSDPGLAVLPVSLVCFLGGLPLTIPAAGIELNIVGLGRSLPG